jgi:hypothetical protein
MLEQGQLQRRSVKEALRASFSGRRGLGYIPPALERLRGAFLCVSCPEPVRGHSLRQTIRSTCRIRCPLPVPDPVVYVGGPVRGTGGGYVTPAAGSAGAHRGAKLGGVFANGGNANETRDAVLFFQALRTGCGSTQRVRQRLHEKVCCGRLYFVSVNLHQCK